MIRRVQGVDWSQRLRPEDMSHVLQRVDPDGWYSMATFERLGEEIFREVAKGDVNLVRVWGRFSVDPLHEQTPGLVANLDPADTLMRFRVLRATYFDFDALEVPVLADDHAQLVIRYYMGPVAEEAAAFQTLGFFERLLELAGADDVRSEFLERAWKGDARTLLDLRWKTPKRPAR